MAPRSAVLGDINHELITTMRELQRDPLLVLECIRRLPIGKSHYYRIRATLTSAYSPAEQAARFIYLNRYCFNGLYRTNRQGEFNVPYAHPKSRSRSGIDEETMIAAAKILRRATLVNSDFEVTLGYAQPGDFVYLDPPYVVAKRRIFADYGSNSFQASDLARLEKALVQLNTQDVKFVITYADSSEARELLRRWQTKRVWTKRNISGFVAHRRGAYELLATNVNHDINKY
jgi:DNA adenine methylase